MILPKRYTECAQRLRGGMGEVYQCDDTILQRKVAIKTLQAGGDPRRMLDEVKALLRLRSNHVVQVYDLIKSQDGEIGIVQEYIQGSDLLGPDTKPSDAGDFYRMIWQIASGIADIHAQGVIHRDIKPNNMKRDGEGVIKIFDFGLAREDGPAARTEAFNGTFGFAAPELFSPPYAFTPAIDVYAFAATALYILTRTLPIELRGTVMPLPISSNPFLGADIGLAAPIAEILYSCFNHDPSARPAMAQIRDMLASHLLAGRHRALIVFQSRPHNLDATNTSVNINLPGRGSMRISYNQHEFIVGESTGDVFVNNQQAVVGQRLPGSCVIALGDPAQPSLRRYVTFDVSHPEVIL